MSTMADYYAPDETPDFRDPTPEELEANALVEERMLAKVRELRSRIDLMAGPKAMGLVADLDAYFQQAIEERDRDMDPDFLDPFGDD